MAGRKEGGFKQLSSQVSLEFAIPPHLKRFVRHHGEDSRFPMAALDGVQDRIPLVDFAHLGAQLLLCQAHTLGKENMARRCANHWAWAVAVWEIGGDEEVCVEHV